MSSPVQLSDLPIASSAANTDLMLLRKGLTDYQITVLNLLQINIGALNPISEGFAVNTDLMIIARSGSNYNIRFSQLSVIKGTKAWFCQNTAPTDWQITPNTGDTLLGVSEPGNLYNGTVQGGVIGGSWQQQDAILTIEQIPAHSHRTPAGKDQSGSSGTTRFARRAVDYDKDSYIYDNTTGGKGSNLFETDPTFTNPFATPATLGHNHGSTWRPRATVGIVCTKTA